MKKQSLFLSNILFLSNLYGLQAADFTILHTNDLHSYFDGVLVKEMENGGVKTHGNYARLATAIRNTRRAQMAAGDDFTLLIDAGDFYSGTLFHAIAPRADIKSFPEYEYFNELQYDLVTLGNHEFDAGTAGLDNMLDKIRALGAKTPIVATNFEIPKKHRDIILTSMIKEYPVKDSDDVLKIGFLGALGPDGCKVSASNRQNYSFVGFDDKKSKARWKELYAKLKDEAAKLKKQGAKVIILSIHGGGNGKDAEDEKIAKKVKDIDVIIAGHTHESYLKQVGDTIISQADFYGQQLGVLPFHFDEKTEKLTFKGKINNSDYKIIITEAIKEDPVIAAKIDQYRDEVDAVLAEQNLPAADTPVLRVNRDLPSNNDKVNPLGVYLTSRILDSVKKTNESVDVFFTTTGLIRTGLFADYEYNASEVFKILPLGFGKNFKVGTPVVSFYLTKKEFKHMVEFLYLYAKKDDKYTPVFSSSVEVKMRKWGIPFINKIKELKINGVDYKELPELVHISTNEFIFKNVQFVKKKTFGLLKFIPKDKDGNEVKEVPHYSSEFENLIND